MAFPTYDGNHQDAIALRLYGNSHGNLQQEQQDAIDGDWSSGSLTRGHAFEAENTLKQYANFIAATGSEAGDIPAAWESWFIWEAVAAGAVYQSPDRYKLAAAERDRALRNALATYVVTDADNSTSTLGLSVVKLNIRKQVLHTCIHQREMLLPSPDVIDAGIKEVLQRVWYRADWAFRRVSEIIEFIDNGGTKPTVTYGTGNQPEKIVSKRLFFEASGASLDLQGAYASGTSYSTNDVVLEANRLYKSNTDSNQGNAPTTDTTNWTVLGDESLKGTYMEMATDDQMAYLLSLTQTEGRPQWFRVVLNSSDQMVWYIDRNPDVTYFLRCEVIASLPDLTTAANVDTAIALMPKTMHDILRMGTLEYVLAAYGRGEASLVRRTFEDQLDDLTDRDDVGNVDLIGEEVTSRQVFHEVFDGQDLLGNIVGGGV